MITAGSSPPWDWALPRSAQGEAHGRLLSSLLSHTHTHGHVYAPGLGHTRPGASPRHTIKVLDAAPSHSALFASSPCPFPPPSQPPSSRSRAENRKLRSGLGSQGGGWRGRREGRGGERGGEKESELIGAPRALPSPPASLARRGRAVGREGSCNTCCSLPLLAPSPCIPYSALCAGPPPPSARLL